MNEIYFKIQELRLAQREREIFLKNLREQIRRDEENLQELDNSIEQIKQDIHDLKQTIAALKKFTS